MLQNLLLRKKREINPRVSREKMLEFIEGDLDKAEEYIKYFSRPKKTLPDLACIYGLKARLYMWVEDYAKAKEYARKSYRYR